jgi:hypothetical protein
MRWLFVYFGLFSSSFQFLAGQQNDSVVNFLGQKSIYPLIIEDAPARLFTMRQFDESYLSTFRLYSKMLNTGFSPTVNLIVKTASFFFAFGPLTHEEGHRSILIEKNIGSISQPFFLSRRGGYIDGVTDSTLKDLRDKDFPDYMRLYGAGLESDYMLTHREEALFAFEDETYKNLAIEYILRKFSIMQYYLMGVIKYNIDGAEESNELKRDIVGNDVYGQIRHMHRPTMPFYRYTRYSDLAPQEVRYLKKMELRSLFNLVNLNIVGIPNFNVSDNLKANIGMGHIMCPFGDFIDENLWLKYMDKLKVEAYIREFQNNSRWFLGGGLGIKDYPVTRKFMTSINVHLWNQPANLNFNENASQFGGAVEIIGRYFFLTNQKTKLKALSADLGLIWKTNGYLPEEIVLRRHFGFRFGTSFALDK